MRTKQETTSTSSLLSFLVGRVHGCLAIVALLLLALRLNRKRISPSIIQGDHVRSSAARSEFERRDPPSPQTAEAHV